MFRPLTRILVILAMVAEAATLTATDEPGETVKVALYDWQMEAMQATEPSIACVTPVGEGKSWFGGHWLAYHSIANPLSICFAGGNESKQIDRVIIPNLIRAFEDYGAEYTHRSSKFEFVVHTDQGDGLIWYGSLNSEAVIDRLRGTELGKVWLDEGRDTKEYAYQVILGRMRHPAEPNHQILITTTTRGFNWVHTLFVKRGEERSRDGRKLRRHIHVTKRGNYRLPKNYDANLRGSYDEALARQELEAAYVALGSGTVYRAFNRAVNVRAVRYDPTRPLYLGVDFGWRFQVLTVLQWHPDPEAPSDPERGEIHILCEAWCEQLGIDDSVRKLAAIDPRWPAHESGWEVWPDPSGKNHEASGRVSMALLMQALEVEGFKRCKLRALSKAPSVSDAVNATNAVMRNGVGVSRLFVSKKCEHWIADAEECVWDDSGKEISRSPEIRTHSIHSTQYVIWARHRPSAFKREPRYEPRGSGEAA